MAAGKVAADVTAGRRQEAQRRTLADASPEAPRARTGRLMALRDIGPRPAFPLFRPPDPQANRGSSRFAKSAASMKSRATAALPSPMPGAP